MATPSSENALPGKPRNMRHKYRDDQIAKFIEVRRRHLAFDIAAIGFVVGVNGAIALADQFQTLIRRGGIGWRVAASRFIINPRHGLTVEHQIREFAVLKGCDCE